MAEPGDVNDYHENSLSLCENAVLTLGQELDGLQALHYTLMQMREEYYYSDDERGKNLLESLERHLAATVAAKKTFEDTMDVLDNKDEIVKSDYERVCHLWENIRRYIDGLKEDTNWRMADFIRWEIERVAPYIGIFSMFASDVMDQVEDSTDEEEKAMDDVIYYKNFLDPWAVISSLFVQYLPEIMSPRSFFLKADGLYMYFPEIVTRIMFVGKHGSKAITSGSTALLWLAKRLCELGYIGPTSHLAHARPTAIDAESMSLGELRDLIEINETMFDPISKGLCSDITDNPDIEWFNSCRLLQLLDKIITDVIPHIKQLYIKLRRSTFYFLDLIFPERYLMEAAHEMISMRNASLDLSLQFEHLREIVAFCMKFIRELPTYEHDPAMDLPIALQKIYYDVVLPINDKLETETWRVRNLAVSDEVCHYYDTVIKSIVDYTAIFVLKYAERAASLNIHPQQLGQTYTNFKKLMYICVC